MTYRERREQRATRRENWAEGRRAKQAQAFDRAEDIASGIPPGQPILVGHHSEKHARRDQDRIHGAMTRGVEHGRVAERHDTAARTIRRQLDTSIYTDDRDEVERLEAKLATLEARRDRRKAINTWLRANLKAHGFKKLQVGPALSDGDTARAARLLDACNKALSLTANEREDLLSALSFNMHLGYPAYASSNLNATINRVKKRLPAARRRS